MRDAKTMLEKMTIGEVTSFIEKNSHPKLWSLLAEEALHKLDFPTAEHAFVMLKDYAALQFLKKVNNIQVNVCFLTTANALSNRIMLN